MAKHYVDLDDHGVGGDFYRFGESVYRADNLKIATQIAFNEWLRDFDNLGRSCTLVSLEPGRFVVSISDEPEPIEFTDIAYHGLADMFEAPVIQDNCSAPEFRELLAKMQEMESEKHPAVRVSNATGRVIFHRIPFPRYHADGAWWSWENDYLDTNPIHAQEQIEYAVAGEDDRAAICRRNRAAMLHNWEVK